MLKRLALGTILAALAGAIAVTYWVAQPSETPLPLPAPLEAWMPDKPTTEAYDSDAQPLMQAFRPQEFRSFCGPASIATVLRAYGRSADQKTVLPIPERIEVFYSGMTLAELGALARQAGLRARVVYADTLGIDEFRELLKSNLSRAGDFVLLNYDRRVLKQSGAGHISPIADYDPARDAFLVLDEAAYRYPFTWIPASLLHAAAQTRDGDHSRGVLLVEGLVPAS
jgi:hypothetical protein